MTRQHGRKYRDSRRQAISDSEPATVLDSLLALDRMVVELSMHVYNIPRGDRFLVREQNRRLHDAVRKRLPDSQA